MKSTSIHNLNADKGLNLLEKPLYLLLNFINNLFPYINVDKRIKFEKWRGGQNFWNETYPDSSAARKLSDLFWRSLPWENIKEELGEINVFDTGCGHGNYSLRLWEGINSYTGIDTKRRENWAKLEKEHPTFHFIESNSTDILSLIPPKTNFFMSQSAIEHFDEDLKFFEQIKEYVEKSEGPIIQVHLFPAASTLPLYLFHGLRQYTPRTISKITRLFGDSSEFFLYGLGGNKSKSLHWQYFTWPVLILRKYTKPTFDVAEYEPKLKKAIEHDLEYPNKSPLFWALIIKSKIK